MKPCERRILHVAETREVVETRLFAQSECIILCERNSGRERLAVRREPHGGIERVLSGEEAVNDYDAVRTKRPFEELEEK